LVKECIEVIESNLEIHELKKITRSLYGHYDSFLMDSDVWRLLEEALPTTVYNKISQYKDILVGHSIINELVIKYFPGEITIKYNFIKNFLFRLNEISTFELKIGSSRLDIGRINGKSIAYEIKTELDSLEKLEKQILDYSRAFEYIYIIIHPSHYKKAIEIVPEYCGIILYNLTQTNCKFHYKRKAQKNKNINALDQLSILTKKELKQFKKEFGMFDNTPIDRKIAEKVILENNSNLKINTIFKAILKKRYCKKWEHLCNNFSNIMPVDVQTFFSTQANPYWVYYKNSSIV